MATTSSKKEVFQIEAPGAKQVQLVGGFSNWQQRPIPMIKGVDGFWRATVILPEGKHEYQFLVDGSVREDPNCPERGLSLAGGAKMVRVVEIFKRQ